MKFIKLLTAAYVGGVLRHPHEGVLHVNDEDAQRVLDDKVGEDVTGDFTTKDNKDVAADGISAAVDVPADPSGSQPHQSEVAPQATEEPTKTTSRKAASAKE